MPGVFQNRCRPWASDYFVVSWSRQPNVTAKHTRTQKCNDEIVRTTHWLSFGAASLRCASALDHHQRERSGQHCSSASAARRRRSKFRGDEEQAMIGGIEPHVS